jgi:BirA family biotin operon repressor/biotin-[acetyl-CoA-carboxylase] ligase
MAVSPARNLEGPALLALLADGGVHSGERLAGSLGVSRTAVWKAVLRLRARGIVVEAVARTGYRLPRAVELLSAEAIRGSIGPDRMARLRRLESRFEVDSTNSQLLAAPAPPTGFADAMLAELQHAGRGRRGREWIAPFGACIALSLGWSFADASRANPALSLCVGVAVIRALTRAGAAGIGLKWPNDIWHRDRKVGGILLEMHAEAGGAAHVVIGVGLNNALTEAERTAIELSGVRVAAVADACIRPPSRNFLAGAIIDELLSMLVDFERSGFEGWRDQWLALDVLRDRPVRVLVGGSATAGIARGVDLKGALLIERDGGLLEVVSGEVSLRLQEDAS